MLPKSQHPEHKSTSAKAPPPAPKPEPEPAAVLAPAPVLAPASGGRISAARAAVQQFLSSELGAREIRITKIAPLDHGSVGWSAEAEILMPNLELKMLGLPLTQEVLELERYMVELETDLSVRSYGHLGVGDD